MDYKFVDFSFFKSSESWISYNEKSKIKGLKISFHISTPL
jgi:hypothetical protein